MEYKIHNTYTYNEFIIIDENTFIEIVEARSLLQSFLNMEEKLNYVIDNYIEFEQELLNTSINNLVTPMIEQEWKHYVSEIHKITRRIINLLSTSKMYLDQVPHDLNKVCKNKKDVVKMFEKMKSKEYDNVFGYRVMEALRNYSQHRDLPIHKISNKVAKTNDNKNKHLIIPVLRTKELEVDDKFKKSVLNELKEIGDKIDLRMYIRQYIQSFYNLQKFIRDILSEDMNNNDQIIQNAYNYFEQKFNNPPKSLSASKYYKNIPVETVHIVYDIKKRRHWLENKNKPKDLINNFVSADTEN